MNSATYPIPVTLRGLTAGTLYRYVLSIYDFADDSNAAIFNGKAIADANGEAVVRIDGVLRDYAYQPRRRWEDGRQGYVPADLIGLPAVLTPIEDGSRFMMTSATVTVYDNNGNIVTSQSGILVWAGRTASWMSGEPLYGVGQWCDFALLGNGMVPHLPPVDTTNMWLSLVLQWFRTDAATLHVGAHSAAITPTAAGCLAASFTLADLHDLAASDINGGNADSTYDETLDGGDSDAVALQAVINGTADYIAGKGFVDPAAESKIVDEDGGTLLTLVQRCVADYLIFGALTIGVRRNSEKQIAALDYHDPRHFRLAEDGKTAYYCKDWARNSRKVVAYPIFNPANKEPNSSVFYFKAPRCRTLYGLPMWSSATKDVQTAIEISTFHLSAIMNNFVPSAIVNFNNGTPDEATQKEIEGKLVKKFSGSKNAARLLVSFNDSRVNATTLERLTEDHFDQRYNALAKSCKENISRRR